VPTLLVFGARNMGRVLTRECVRGGWNAAAVARTQQTIDLLHEQVPDALGIVADAAQPAEVERAIAQTRERFGRIDLVVNAITDGPRSGSILELGEDAFDSYLQQLLPAIFNVIRLGSRALVAQGGGTFVQMTGGSARRGMPNRGPWAATAFATRALTQSVAAELRSRMVHVVLLIVDAIIESEKTEEWMRGEPPEKFASMDEVAKAIAYLHGQSPRAWTHELQVTPALETWVP
jgi:NAD(P)-dependent dehydrogenase (short-subunit alcohol dehydrogenase family)